jgi:hypothetical protein
MAPSIHIRALNKAIEVSGGRKELAARLEIKAADIEKWLAGKAEIPEKVFLRIVDVIIDELTGWDSDPGDPPAPRLSAPSSQWDCE